MKINKQHIKTEKFIKKIKEQFSLVYKIVQAIEKNGGRAVLVGGAVRDLLLNLSIKDVDIEVYNLQPEVVEKILRQFGPVSLVGKVFGVFRVHGLDVDWSLPRADSPGRKPEVKIDPFMSYHNAFVRRDLTINAMGIDLSTSELIDPFNGVHDVKKKILRSPDTRFFIQDPLRFYRVMQFVGRFEMLPDEELNALCSTMDISDVSRERIEQEFKKLLLKSARPSRGIRWLHAVGRLSDVLPELTNVLGVAQNKDWHPEGDVFEHTMQALDAAATIAKKYENELDQLVLMYAALCHDLGKATTTYMEQGLIKSIGHEKESERLAKKLMKRITHNSDLISAVAKLVKYHMIPSQLVSGKAKLSAFKRLANKLAPETSMQMLADLSLADKRGRNPRGENPLKTTDSEIKKFLKKVDEAQVLKTVEKPLLLGRDIADLVQSGPKMGELLKKAYEIQLEEGIQDKELLKRKIIKLFKKF